MKNRISKAITLVIIVAAIQVVVAGASSLLPDSRASSPIAATSAAATFGAVESEQTKRRVTFHNAAEPGPEVSALIKKYAGSSVLVQRQHFVHKRHIGVPEDDGTGWVFEREKLTQTLLRLKPILDAEADRDNPQFLTVMFNLEPHYRNPGSSRIAVMNDALGLARTIFGQRVQVGFQGLPHQRGLNVEGVPPIRIYDSVIANQGAIFIHPRFTKKGAGWFEAGMRLTRALLSRVEPIRDGRPVIAFVWARRSAPAGFALIPDDELRQQIRLLIDADVEISVFGSFDAETAHVIELARSVILEEDP